jgi:FkbM family methyltransferase
MAVASTLKRIAIVTGTYTAARRLERRVRGRSWKQTAEIGFYKGLIVVGSLCFDVGANIGEKSEALLEAGARVVAFEPNPRVWDELIARCGSSPRWTLIRAGIGAGEGICTFFQRASSAESGMIEHWEGPTIGSTEIPVISLDAAIRKYGMPAYCKIDVEGWELEVLKGLSHQIPLLSFEFHLTPDDLAKTRACLEMVGRLGRYQVNVSPAETPGFLSERWTPLEQCLSTFPDLLTRISGLEYGDLYLRVEG